MGPHPTQRRLHLIVGDGHRSHFNLALQMGATALALKAMQSGAPSATAIHRELHKVPLQRRNENWVGTLTRLNRLAAPGALPVVDPSAIAVQRIYLNAARSYLAATANPKEWMPRILEDWQQTLDAYERQDRAWLTARLDTFIKHELFTHYLEAAGSSWLEVVGCAPALSALALLDHDYHAISQPGSSFDGLEQRGLLRHRVGPRVTAGDEDEPYVPDVDTRARTRARFIKDQAPNADAEWIMAWDHVRDTATGRMRTLFDPYATAYRG